MRLARRSRAGPPRRLDCAPAHRAGPSVLGNTRDKASCSGQTRSRPTTPAEATKGAGTSLTAPFGRREYRPATVPELRVEGEIRNALPRLTRHDTRGGRFEPRRKRRRRHQNRKSDNAPDPDNPHTGPPIRRRLWLFALRLTAAGSALEASC